MKIVLTVKKIIGKIKGVFLVNKNSNKPENNKENGVLHQSNNPYATLYYQNGEKNE